MQYADRWTLAHFRDLATVGIYAVAVKMGAAMMLGVSAFQLAWGPFAFARARDPGAARLFSRVLTLYVAVAATFALLLGLFAAEALGVLVPGAYARAALPGGLLCFAAVAHGAYYIVALGANLSLRTDLLAWTSLVAAAVNVALNLAARPARSGSAACRTATLVGFALSTVLLYTLAQRVHPIPFRGLRARALFLARHRHAARRGPRRHGAGRGVGRGGVDRPAHRAPARLRRAGGVPGPPHGAAAGTARSPPRGTPRARAPCTEERA